MRETVKSSVCAVIGGVMLGLILVALLTRVQAARTPSLEEPALRARVEEAFARARREVKELAAADEYALRAAVLLDTWGGVLPPAVRAAGVPRARVCNRLCCRHALQ